MMRFVSLLFTEIIFQLKLKFLSSMKTEKTPIS